MTTNEMTLTNTQVLAAITNGDLDTDLGTIIRAATRRQKVNAYRTFRPGTKARITGGISPKYLTGTEVTVVKVNPKRIVIQMPDNIKARFAGAEVTIPSDCLELVA